MTTKWAAILLLATVAAFGGGCKLRVTPATDGGAGASGGSGVACTHAATGQLALGTTCACNQECASGHCIDGVCCASTCGETCHRCDVPGSIGTCAPAIKGQAPREPAQCPMSDVADCGMDGTCDGAGGCARYADGVLCGAGVCHGSAVTGLHVCDGAGRCRPGADTLCAPFGCNASANACADGCASDADCAHGVSCVAGSCGPKPNGATCRDDTQCGSGFCVDGVCCNAACQGGCVACNQPGRLGTCWPVTEGRADPRGVCTDQGKTSCGRTGLCDGVGSCALYAAETVCAPATCGGDRLNTAGTCDGRGSCRQAGVRDCKPYRCIDGACVNRCANDGECVAPNVCHGGSCGKKGNGLACTAAGDCASGFCVDGVCCENACAGACRTCALASAMGVCSLAPAGAADPRRTCVAQATSTCGTDGRCDGAGACRKHAAGTVCASEKCENVLYTAPATCDTTGKCVAPSALTCVPFSCNGSKCSAQCATDANCSPGNTCTSGSCGKKPLGAVCAAAAECASNVCAQGVCCATACSGACKSCAVPGAVGQCSNVPTGQSDPSGRCVDQGATSCGSTGRCETGACQRYPQGTVCRPASCPPGGTTLTPEASCDGAGRCVMLASVACAPYACGGNACRASCTSNADCAPPASCMAGSCGLKPAGAVCSSDTECVGHVCAQGVCCTTACSGSCMSCAVAGKLGTCSAIAAGSPDPTGRCKNEGAASCKATGLCNGAGGCALYPAGTTCAGTSCPVGQTMATLARTCDGAGVCQPATMQSCGAYACNGTSCNAACATDADCAPGRVCNAGSCGLKRLGQACAGGAECEGGRCVDGVCCASATCAACQACNVAGSAGACTPVAAGTSEPHDRCAAAPPCGNDGKCDGRGGCSVAPASNACGVAACVAGTFTPMSRCTGTGSCAPATPVSCAPYLCGSATACLTQCTSNAQCTTGYACASGTCTPIKGNGTACAAGAECASGYCTEGVCCAVSSCGSCNSCAIAGSAGSCAPVPAGAKDPAGTCNPMRKCEMNSVLASMQCDGAGTCVSTRVDCSPFKCKGNDLLCPSSCDKDSDCLPGMKCDNSGGSGGRCVLEI